MLIIFGNVVQEKRKKLLLTHLCYTRTYTHSLSQLSDTNIKGFSIIFFFLSSSSNQWKLFLQSKITAEQAFY